jgi:S4 domain-containing protein
MRLAKLLVDAGTARTGGEANRLVKQGAIQVGGCSSSCTFFSTGKCSCGGWVKITDPVEEIEVGLAVKVGNGMWRTIPRIDGRQGFDQLPGVCRAN